jgi:hypothetical protein
MKTCFRILVFCCILSPAQAQIYIPLHIGDNWGYRGSTMGACEGTSVVSLIASDTLIDGKTYAVFLESSPFGERLIRADSARVYSYDTSLSAEQVVLDFFAKPGDTVSVRRNGTLTTVALGSLQFEEFYQSFSTILSIRDSIGVISMWTPAVLCLMELSSAHIDGKDYVLSISQSPPEAPGQPLLAQNYPNPFNPTTTIRAFIPRTEEVSLSIFDMLGRPVHTILEGRLTAGWHSFAWNALGRASGMYICRLRGKHVSLSRLLVFLK